MTAYAELDANKYVTRQIGRLDPPDFVGPEEPAPPADPGCTCRKLTAAIDWSNQPTPTSKMRWLDTDLAPAWAETAALADSVASAIDQIDTKANAARAQVLAQPTNNEEYHQAEPDARSFKDAGYPAASVPESVQAWADAKWRDNWTAQQAADDIIATADAWRSKYLLKIRRLRLVAKEDVRHAAAIADVYARVQQFSTDLNNLMTS